MAENEVTTTDIEALKISEDDIATMSVKSLSDRPSEHSSQYGQKGLSAQEIKTKLSELPEHIAGNFNGLIDILLKLIPAIEGREVASISFNDDGKLFISFKDGDAPVTMSGSWADNVANGGNVPPTAKAVKKYVDDKETALKGSAIGIPEFDKNTGKLIFKTLDGKQTNTDEINILLESEFKGGYYDADKKELVIQFKSGGELRLPASALLCPTWVSDIDEISDEQKATPPTAEAVKKYTDDTVNAVETNAKEYTDTAVSAVEADVTDVKSDVKNITRRVENLEDLLVEEKVVESTEYATYVPPDVGEYAFINKISGISHDFYGALGYDEGVTKIKLTNDFIKFPYKDPIYSATNQIYHIDGTKIIVRGTPGNSFYSYTFNRGIKLPVGKSFKLSGCPVGGNSTTYNLTVSEFINGDWVNDYHDYGEGVEVTSKNNATYNISVIFYDRHNYYDGLTFDPKLTCEEYEETNYEIPEAIRNMDGYGLGLVSGVRVYCNYIDFNTKRYYPNIVKLNASGNLVINNNNDRNDYIDVSEYIKDNVIKVVPGTKIIVNDGGHKAYTSFSYITAKGGAAE